MLKIVEGAVINRFGSSEDMGPFLSAKPSRRGPGRLPFKAIIHVAGINMFWCPTEYSIRQSVKNALHWPTQNRSRCRPGTSKTGEVSIKISIQGGVMRFAEKIFHPAWVMAVAAVIGLSGCNAVKPSYVDTSGDKIRSVVVYANFRSLINDAPSDMELSNVLADDVCRYIQTKDVGCEASLKRTPPESTTKLKNNVSHMISIDAELFSRFIPGDRIWNPCQTEITKTECTPGFDSAKNWNDCLNRISTKECVSGFDQLPDTPSRMRMTVDVVETKRGKSVFKLDKPQTFNYSDKSGWAASGEPASALFQGLKKAGFF